MRNGIPAVLAAAALAAGTALIAAEPAAAADPWCAPADYFKYSSGKKRMETCVVRTISGVNYLYSAKTHTWSVDWLRGFHGCVRIEGTTSSGVTLLSDEHRYGVSAEHHREDTWSWSTSKLLVSYKATHRRC